LSNPPLRVCDGAAQHFVKLWVHSFINCHVTPTFKKCASVQNFSFAVGQVSVNVLSNRNKTNHEENKKRSLFAFLIIQFFIF